MEGIKKKYVMERVMYRRTNKKKLRRDRPFHTVDMSLTVFHLCSRGTVAERTVALRENVLGRNSVPTAVEVSGEASKNDGVGKGRDGRVKAL